MSRPTLARVAEQAGYSIATVSRALNNDESVLPETRERIIRICDEMGYRPSIAGRHLSQGSKAVVGLSLGQKDYAASDVRYLHALKAELDKRLVREGRMELAQACFDFLPHRAELDLAGWPEIDIFAHM